MQAEILTSPDFDLDTDGYAPTVMMQSLCEAPAIRKNQRFPERIIAAVHQACDVGDLGTAGRLLSVLDTILEKKNWSGVGPARQRLMKAIISAHERLWHLRHPSEGVGYPLNRMLDLAR
jgi:hypothetical protein